MGLSGVGCPAMIFCPAGILTNEVLMFAPFLMNLSNLRFGTVSSQKNSLWAIRSA